MNAKKAKELRQFIKRVTGNKVKQASIKDGDYVNKGLITKSKHDPSVPGGIKFYHITSSWGLKMDLPRKLYKDMKKAEGRKRA